MTVFSEDLYGGRLTIDPDAIASNWRLLNDRLSSATACAAAVKANAYGTGLAIASKALFEAGCQFFFVATPVEAIELRHILPEATIYVLDGLLPGCSDQYLANDIRPVLGSIEEVDEWVAFCRAKARPLPAAIHVDTGIHRLGLSPGEFCSVMRNQPLVEAFSPSLIMSHLACGSTPENPMNAEQLSRFKELTSPFAAIPRSLANSAGIFMGEEYHFDLVRPGISLYGGKAIDTADNLMSPVVKVEARLLMVRDVPIGDTIGYGATKTAQRPTKNAVVAAGYADGLLRAASSADDKLGGFAMIGGYKAPILGRISMDMITLDVTDVPNELLKRGAFVEMLGPNVATSDLAAYASTIDYEYLTSLGNRFQRVYGPLS